MLKNSEKVQLWFRCATLKKNKVIMFSSTRCGRLHHLAGAKVARFPVL